MKISVNSVCDHCSMVKDKTAIVDYDMETGKTTVLYYVGHCCAGYKNEQAFCALKKVADELNKRVEEIAEAFKAVCEAIKPVLEPIVETLIKIAELLVQKEMEKYEHAHSVPHAKPNRQYNVLQRGNVLQHRVQYKQKGYHKHRRRGEAWR